MLVDVKICGLKTPAAIATAVAGGARYVGFVFFPPSPRSLDAEHAAELVRDVPPHVSRVGLFVDADNAFFDSILGVVTVDVLQLHGTEPPERVAEIKQRFGLPVIKAVAVDNEQDLAHARIYQRVADRLLFDARAPAEATRPGGNALSFDWRWLKDYGSPLPWILAGGIDASNVEEAVRQSGARTIDVSSGVEIAPGVKNVHKIRAFLEQVRRMSIT